MARVLFHIDLNAFFVSAEELRHPELQGKAVAVGSLSNRGVIATANYLAREKGIHSAMPTRQALQIDPDLVILPNDKDYYRKLSNDFFRYLRNYTPQLEPVSIDECYMDVTEIIKKYKRPLDLAYQIQQGVKKATGLSCSIGVAPTRFLAKMASDLQKPMGISIIRRSDIKTKLWPLPIEKMLGIGKKRLEPIQQLGIQTIGDLADPENEEKLVPVLKSSYYKMMDQVYGKSSDKLSFNTSRKSISHSSTFSYDLYSINELYEQASIICRELFNRMAQNQKFGKHVSLTLRDKDFNTKVHSISLDYKIDSPQKLNGIVRRLIDDHFEEVGYRLMGITIGSFDNSRIEQPTIFETINPTESIVSDFNSNFKEQVLMKASDLLKK